MAETGGRPLVERLRPSVLLPSGGLGRAVSILAGGAALAQAIVALSSLVITRLYTPAAFGLYGTATAIANVIAVFACLRYEVAIPLPEDTAGVAAVGLGVLDRVAE